MITFANIVRIKELSLTCHSKVSEEVCVLAQRTVTMKQPDMYVASIIADFFLYRHTAQVTLFVCWGLGKFS
jgi:hypothetical protein